jgi:hypothetical protein
MISLRQPGVFFPIEPDASGKVRVLVSEVFDDFEEG